MHYFDIDYNKSEYESWHLYLFPFYFIINLDSKKFPIFMWTMCTDERQYRHLNWGLLLVAALT